MLFRCCYAKAGDLATRAAAMAAPLLRPHPGLQGCAAPAARPGVALRRPALLAVGRRRGVEEVRNGSWGQGPRTACCEQSCMHASARRADGQSPRAGLNHIHTPNSPGLRPSAQNQGDVRRCPRDSSGRAPRLTSPAGALARQERPAAAAARPTQLCRQQQQQQAQPKNWSLGCRC